MGLNKPLTSTPCKGRLPLNRLAKLADRLSNGNACVPRQPSTPKASNVKRYAINRKIVVLWDHFLFFLWKIRLRSDRRSWIASEQLCDLWFSDFDRTKTTLSAGISWHDPSIKGQDRHRKLTSAAIFGFRSHAETWVLASNTVVLLLPELASQLDYSGEGIFGMRRWIDTRRCSADRLKCLFLLVVWNHSHETPPEKKWIPRGKAQPTSSFIYDLSIKRWKNLRNRGAEQYPLIEATGENRHSGLRSNAYLRLRLWFLDEYYHNAPWLGPFLWHVFVDDDDW